MIGKKNIAIFILALLVFSIPKLSYSAKLEVQYAGFAITGSYADRDTFAPYTSKILKIIDEGRGIDVKGKGGATMEMVGSLTDSGDGTTEINGDSTVTIQGMLAQFGSRMVEDVSNQLFLQFTKSLAAKLEGNGEQADETESSIETLSGVAVVGAAIKGVSGRLMDKFKKKED